MSILDGIIREAARRFDLGDKGAPLASALLGLISDSRTGGIRGFVDRFRQAGLGGLVDSWLGRGPNEDLEPRQLEQVIGRDSIERVSESAGLAPAQAAPALAFLVPKIIDMITPDGIVPAVLPAGMAGLAGFGGAGRPAGAGVAGAAGGYAEPTLSGIRNEPGSGAGLRKLIPILALLLLGFLGWQLLGRDRTGIERQTGAVTDSGYTTPAVAPDPAATPTTPSTGADIDVSDPRAAVDAAMRRATDALAALRPGYTAEQLVDALNLNIVNFASGSAALPAESRGVLDRSAEAIRGAPEGTVLQVGGHTDNTGNAAANQRLSQQRADAVRRYLVGRGVPEASLRARGFGPANPVADNSTEAGRFRNRRIEFTVVR